MNSTKKLITDLNVDPDIDLTFERLKRSSYETLVKELHSRYGRLYEVSVNGTIHWPPGSVEIIRNHGWTTKELFNKAYGKIQNRFY